LSPSLPAEYDQGMSRSGSGKKTIGNEIEKVRKLILGKFKYPNYGKLSHKKTALSAPLMEQRKCN
jgi:hypothetical protein